MRNCESGESAAGAKDEQQSLEGDEQTRWGAIARIAPVTFTRAAPRGPITEPHATTVGWGRFESSSFEAHEALIRDLQEDPFGPHLIFECGPVAEPFWVLRDTYRLESAEQRARYEATLARLPRRYRENVPGVNLRDFARVPGGYDRPTNRPDDHAGVECVRLRHRSARDPISFERLEAIARERAELGSRNAKTTDTTDRTPVGGATSGARQDQNLPVSMPRKPRGVRVDVGDGGPPVVERQESDIPVYATVSWLRFYSTLFGLREGLIPVRPLCGPERIYASSAGAAGQELAKWEELGRGGRVCPVTFTRSRPRGPVDQPVSTRAMWMRIECPTLEALETALAAVRQCPFAPHLILQCGHVLEVYWLRNRH